MPFKVGDKVIGYYHLWKVEDNGVRSSVNYTGTILYIQDENTYVIEDQDGTEQLVDFLEEDTMEIYGQKLERQ